MSRRRAARYHNLIPNFIFSNAAIGACIGFLFGACLAFLLRTGRAGMVWDALLGAVAFVGGIFAATYIPTAPNTVARQVGNTIVRTTARHYQHPYFAALMAVFTVVLIHRVIRAVRTARSSKTL